MSPDQLDEFTDNDILEEIFRRRQEDKDREKAMQRQAWYTLLAGMNRPAFGFEHKWQDFTAIFPEDVKPLPKTDPEQTRKICKAHNLNLIEE